MNDTWYRYLPSRCGYRLAQGQLPPMDSNAPYFLEYLLAANGLFVRSTRSEMEACIPIAPCVVGGGLPPLQPYVRLNGPRVPASLLCEVIFRARSAALPNGRNIEQLFFLHLTEGRWTLAVPPQAATALSVRATLDALDPRYCNAVLEVHSHPNGMNAFFSKDDDQEELGKFRLFAVLGQIEVAPEISVRVGLWAHFCSLPASAIFELPEGIQDVYDKKARQEVA